MDNYTNYIPVCVDKAKMEIERFRDEANCILLFIQNIEIKSKNDVASAIDFVARAKTLMEKINLAKKELTQEARDHIVRINNMSKDFLEPLCLVKEIVYEKIDKFKSEYENGLEEIGVFDDITTIRSDRATLTDRISYSFVEQDINLVPRQYLCVDEKKVKQAIKAGVRTIAGLDIIEKTTPYLRRN